MVSLKRRAFNQQLLERISQYLAKGHSLEIQPALAFAWRKAVCRYLANISGLPMSRPSNTDYWSGFHVALYGGARFAVYEANATSAAPSPSTSTRTRSPRSTHWVATTLPVSTTWPLCKPIPYAAS